MRIGETAGYLGMSVVGVRKAAEEGRLPCRRSASGQRLFDRADLDAYLGRPVPVADAGGRERVEALYCRVSGSTFQESSLANQERMLRDTAQGRVFRAYRDRGSGLRESRRGLDRLLDDAAGGRFTVVRVVWRDRLARFGVAWIERYLSVCGVSVEALHDRGDKSLLEELMDDFMAVLASFSGRFYQLRSKHNQRLLLDAAGERLGQ
jgi:putative resolvase